MILDSHHCRASLFRLYSIEDDKLIVRRAKAEATKQIHAAAIREAKQVGAYDGAVV